MIKVLMLAVECFITYFVVAFVASAAWLVTSLRREASRDFHGLGPQSCPLAQPARASASLFLVERTLDGEHRRGISKARTNRRT